jgi:outer membrane protein TolC
MMIVSRTHNFAARPAILSLCVALGCAIAGGTLSCAQSVNPTSGTNPYYGSVTLAAATGQPIQLSLDDAISRGLQNNLGLRQAENYERAIHGERNQALQAFLPTITLTGDSGFYQHNLAAQGFGPSVLAKFAQFFPPTTSPAISLITRDTLTEGQIRYSQVLFSGPVIAGWRAAGAATRAAHFGKMSARGEVVQQVASAYLHAIAAASEVENAKALEQADLVQLNNAHAGHQAGTLSNLDELRPRVQYQAQQQATIAAENSYEKDLILLKREIGLDPGQKIVLTDRAPYSELAAQTPEEVRAIAYRNRQDYQNLQNQQVELKAVHAAYRSQRFPTLSFSGNYGVQEIGGAGSHGTFAAVGTLSVPLFREASLRGNIDAAQAQVNAINSQLDDLRSKIDQQVRSALLDVNAASQLIEVSRSNVALATRALSDETERVNAGVDNTLPLVSAQATLANAQNTLVESLYQFNVAKLALARASGVLETQYRVFLGR